MFYDIENGRQLDESHSSRGVEKFRKKSRFDDDLEGLPSVKTKLREIRNVRFFTGKGNRVMIDIDKISPEIGIFLKAASLEPYQSVVDLNCAKGHLGIALATSYPDKDFMLVDSNLLNIAITEENVGRNAITNATVQGAVGIEGVAAEEPVDSIIFETANYMSMPFVEQQIALSHQRLESDFPFFMITHRKRGADRHKRYLELYFGQDNVEVLERGKGGVRILKAVKRGNQEIRIPPSTQMVEFQVKGNNFALETNVGLFSKEQLDSGTKLLLETVDYNQYQNLLDVGCGWGPIGIVAATANPEGLVCMVDIDLRATTQAEINVRKNNLDSRVSVMPTTDIKSLNEKFDLVVSNPPFHQDFGTLVKLFNGVRDVMTKDGQLYIVVEKSYVTKFQDVLQNTLGHADMIANDEKYVIMHCRR